MSTSDSGLVNHHQAWRLLKSWGIDVGIDLLVLAYIPTKIGLVNIFLHSYPSNIIIWGTCFGCAQKNINIRCTSLLINRSPHAFPRPQPSTKSRSAQKTGIVTISLHSYPSDIMYYDTCRGCTIKHQYIIDAALLLNRSLHAFPLPQPSTESRSA